MSVVEMVGVVGLILTILGFVIRNAISIASTETKAATAHETAIKSLESFNNYRVSAATEFATHAHLRAVEDRLTIALSKFGQSMERHTDRLDAILHSLAERPKEPHG